MLIFTIFFALLSIFHLYTCYFRIEGLRRLTKPLLLLSLALFYFFFAENASYLVFAALLCGMIGDTFLLWQEKEGLFITGAVVFAIGHVLYSMELLHMAAGLAWWIIPIIALPYAVVIAFECIKVSPKEKYFRALMPVYLGMVAVLSFAAWANLISCIRAGAPAFAASVIVLGSVCFFVSDSILASSIFRNNIKHANFYVMMTYIAAQACLAAGFMMAA